jgi:VCBS repeat protein/ASPIC/UnbV protein
VPPQAAPEVESTVEILDRIAAAMGPEVPFAGEPRVVAMLSKYRHDRSVNHFEQRLRLAHALLRVGNPTEAVEIYDELLEQGRTAGLDASELIDRVGFPRAVAYFRLGEQENCVARHNSDSCLFPIRGRAVHCQPRGSLGAIAAFEAILKQRPDDLVVKWLLNIASMTLGRKPDDIRPEWRIDQKSCRSRDDLAAFTNVAGPLGIAVNGIAGGCVLDDFDGDGYLDIMASAKYPIDAPEGQLRFFRNQKDGAFMEVTREAGLEGIRGGLNLMHADYDNNGYPDVLVLRGAWQMEHGQWPNTLLRNEGDGTFTDVTARAGVLALAPTQAAAWGDFDNDGWVDLFVGNETGFPSRQTNFVSGLWFDLVLAVWSVGNPQVQGHLYHNQGDGTFRDLFQEVGFDTFGWVKGAAWGDYDRDGRIDLYVSRYGAPNLLYHNDGPDESGRWSFTDVSAGAGVTLPLLSFATWFWDYDNDGWDDIFVAGYPSVEVSFPGNGLPVDLSLSNHDEIAEFLGQEVPSDESKPRLFHNRGDGTFADVTKETGLWRAMSVMGANFGDFDNDGYLDIYLGTGAPPFYSLVPNRAFRNAGGRKFDDVTVAANLGTLAKGHGVAFGDVDNDGDQDIYTVLGGAFPGDTFPNALFMNPGHGNDWITLKLEGTNANRGAIGARIELTLAGRSGIRKLFRTVGSGGSFGASSLQQEIGLGSLVEDGGRIQEIRITWPDRAGTVQNLGCLEPNTAYFVREGAPARPLHLDRLRLNTGQ